jgi:hypothetical protein
MAPSTRRDSELIRTARTVLQLQRKIAKWRRQIKAAQLELRHERKMLRGLAYAAENRPDVAPMRLTGGTTGIPLPARLSATERATADRCDERDGLGDLEPQEGGDQ